MKTICKRVAQSLLLTLAKLSIMLHRPFTIAIAGSTDKTLVKDVICEQFSSHRHAVRANPKSYNNEMGLPLSILSLASGNASMLRWLAILIQGFIKTFVDSTFPSVLIVELGVDHPGDMHYLLSMIQPRVAIITTCTSEYISNFGALDRIAKEYAVLVSRVAHNGLVILNSDDERIAALRPAGACTVVTVGEGPLADRQLRDIDEATSTQRWRVLRSNDSTDEFGLLTINRPGAHHRWALSVAMIVHQWYDLNNKL